MTLVKTPPSSEETVSLLIQRVRDRLHHGDIARAESLALEALSASPHHPVARMAVVEVSLRRDPQTAGHDGPLFSLLEGLDNAVAHLLRGQLWQRRGDFAAAATDFAAAVVVDPTLRVAWRELGRCRQRLGKSEGALAAYHRALSLCEESEEPACLQRAELYALIASCYRLRGDWQLAQTTFHHACQVALPGQKTGGWRYQAALSLPPVPANKEEAEEARQRLVQMLRRWHSAPPPLEDPPQDVPAMPFFLTAQRTETKSVLQSLAACYQRSCPSLRGDEKSRSSGSRRRWRVGYVSRHFYQHPVGMMMRALLTGHDRLRFEICLVRLPSARGAIRSDSVSQQLARSADRVIDLPADLSAARERLAAADCDCLVYLDLASDPLAYFLSFSRLARVQCLLPLHPDTSGVPTVDWVLSSGLCEAAHSEDHYSERLWRLPGVIFPLPLQRPALPPMSKGRRVAPAVLKDCGVPEQAVLYLCLAPLYKIDPAFDPVLVAILRQDPNGWLCLHHAREEQWAHALRRRLLMTAPDVVDRIAFLPRLRDPQKWAVLSCGAVMLETPAFNDPLLASEALALGIPVVTLSGSFLRMRQTAALCQKIGNSSLIAYDERDYVQKALNFAEEDELSRQQRRHQAAILFEEHPVVQALEDFFEMAKAE